MSINNHFTVKFLDNAIVKEFFQDIYRKTLSTISNLIFDDTINDFECLCQIIYIIDKIKSFL